MGLNSWRFAPIQDRTKIEEVQKNPIPKVMQIFLKSMGSEMMSGDKIWLICSSFAHELMKHDYTEEEAVKIANLCKGYIRNHRSKITENFMG